MNESLAEQEVIDGPQILQIPEFSAQSAQGYNYCFIGLLLLFFYLFIISLCKMVTVQISFKGLQIKRGRQFLLTF